MIRLAVSLILVAACFSAPVPVSACIWDSDTLDDERRRSEAYRGLVAGLIDEGGQSAFSENNFWLIDVLTGRFERNPPLYYAMRLERVVQQVESAPVKLELYDDAGVACDRLGNGEEALEWMARKEQALAQHVAANGEDAYARDHHYRLLANRGTFLAHEWLRKGADRSDMAMMKAGRDDIVAAIELNPDAHFGREKYQLIAMEWILDPPPLHEPKSGYGVTRLPDPLGQLDEEGRSYIDSSIEVRQAAIVGLAGLVMLGNAWESVDIFHSLYLGLTREGHGSLATLAIRRVSTLIEEGKGSLHPQAPKGDELFEMIYEIRVAPPKDTKGFEEQYQALVQHADEYHALRTEYMMARLRAGRHPDTDAAFWNE